jgi:hypothetical protein
MNEALRPEYAETGLMDATEILILYWNDCKNCEKERCQGEVLKFIISLSAW